MTSGAATAATAHAAEPPTGSPVGSPAAGRPVAGPVPADAPPGAGLPGTIGSGSYDPADVTFLLKDLSAVALERPTEDREEDMQRGRHYSEDLPVEYQPDERYLALYRE